MHLFAEFLLGVNTWVAPRCKALTLPLQPAGRRRLAMRLPGAGSVWGACGLAAAAACSGVARAEPVWLGRFDGSLAPWREVRLKADIPPTRFVQEIWDGEPALVAQSQGSMSLMARPVTIDLQRTPVLCWRWRIDAPLQKADLRTTAGDDYAARLYVSLRLPNEDKSLALRAQLGLARAIWGPDIPDAALNYVWDNRNPVGTEAPNAYTERARMIVQRTGAADAGRWVSERRDLARDAARLFGPRAVPVQLALTADTDNTGESARAGFAQIHAVAESEPCRFAP